MKNLKFQEHLNRVLLDFSPDQHLLIVSKTRTLDEIRAYYDIGHRHFGENRVQELLLKSNELKVSCPEIKWHMIGHLQSNKVKDLFKVHHLESIHSVDSIHLLDELIKNEHRLNQAVGIFLQFNTSREEEKSGFETIEELELAITRLKNCQHLYLQGLMTMGALRVDDQMKSAEACFRELAEVKAELDQKWDLDLQLSMGMSQDYKIALAEGANWLRLGTMMFDISGD